MSNCGIIPPCVSFQFARICLTFSASLQLLWGTSFQALASSWFYGSQWCSTQHSSADIVVSYPINCLEKNKKNHHDCRDVKKSKAVECDALIKCLETTRIPDHLLSCTDLMFWRRQSIFRLSYVWTKQRKSTANVSPPLVASLPTRPPVQGEYGRLDSLWRVRSHLETSGQPKAGTVTITRPQSLWAQTHWEHEKEMRRWDSAGEARGQRRSGTRHQWPVMSQWRRVVSLPLCLIVCLKEVAASQWIKWSLANTHS